MKTLECFLAWRAHQGEVYSAQYDADETALYSIGADGMVCAAARAERRAESLCRRCAHVTDRCAVQFVRWSVQNVSRKVFEMALPIHPPGAVCMPGAGAFAFSGDSEHFLLATPEPYGRIFSVDQPQHVMTLNAHSRPVVAVDWCAANNVCLTCAEDGSILAHRLARAL